MRISPWRTDTAKLHLLLTSTPVSCTGTLGWCGQMKSRGFRLQTSRQPASWLRLFGGTQSGSVPLHQDAQHVLCRFSSLCTS